MQQLSLIDSSKPTLNFKPLLAFTVTDLSQLIYPVYASIKLDGIRAMVFNGIVYSRSMKPIRSRSVQKLFGLSDLDGLDSEILYGEWNAKDVFNKTTQAVMSFQLKQGFDWTELKLAVFDYVSSDPYESRVTKATTIIKGLSQQMQSQIIVLPQQLIHNESELLEFEENALILGYEGVMVRSVTGRYKQGRSTLREGILGKIKRFVDADAKVIGFEERLHNTNEAKINELGHTQRSQSKVGMVGAGTLGALKCVCNGIEFSMGSGFDDEERAEVWNNKDQYLGKIAKFKYQKIGMKDSYRMPIFLGWRDEDDI
jgi:DNA ligase-1